MVLDASYGIALGWPLAPGQVFQEGPGPVVLSVPAGFNLDTVLWPYTFTRQVNGAVTTNFNRAEWCPAPHDLPEAQRAVFYVDASRGTDSGDGLSPATAKRLISSAITLGNNQALPFVVYVQAGVYDRGMCPTGSAGTIVPNKAISLIAVGGRVETGFFDNVAWTLDQGTTYRATRSSVRRVVNLSSPNARGVYPDLVFAASLAACRATPGSWWTDNAIVYVNRADGGVVTAANTRVFLTLAQAPLRMTTSGNMFVSGGFDFQGNTPMILNNNPTGRFYGEDGSARYSSGDDNIVTTAAANHKDNINIGDIAGAVFARWDASASQKDGFNYRMGGSTRPFVVTLDCSAIGCGRPNAASCNGLTGHDGCKGIDKGGLYEDNAGGQCAYVHDDTQAWLIDPVCRNSRGDIIHGGSVPPTDFLVDQTSGGNVPTIWIDNGRSEGSQISRYARYGRVLTRGGSFAGQDYTADGGVVGAY